MTDDPEKTPDEAPSWPGDGQPPAYWQHPGYGAPPGYPPYGPPVPPPAGRGSSSKKRLLIGLGAIAAVVVVVVALVAVLGGGSKVRFGSNQGGSKQADRPIPAKSQFAALVAQEPLIHWTGGWSVLTASGTRAGDVQLDVRLNGQGQGLGTVTAGGGKATVLVLSPDQTLVKGDAAYWMFNHASAAVAATRAGRWVDVGKGDESGVLTELAPSDLSDQVDQASAVERGTASSSGPDQTPPPPGLSSNALRLSVKGAFGISSTWWVTPGPQFKLAGYAGAHFPADETYLGGYDSTTPISLLAAAGTDQDAQALSQQIATSRRSVPPTIATTAEQDDPIVTISEPDECRNGACALTVKFENPSSNDADLTASVKVRMKGSKTQTGTMKEVGTCMVKFSSVRPGKTVKKTCSVRDRRLEALFRSAGYYAYFLESYDLSGQSAVVGFT